MGSDKISFTRKRNDIDGFAVFSFGQKRIKLVGRSVYTTDDDEEIDFLRKDPEIVEIKAKGKGGKK